MQLFIHIFVCVPCANIDMSYVFRWLIQSEPLFRSQARSPNVLVMSALTALCKSVVEASGLVSSLSGHYGPITSVRGAASAARNFVLSAEDKDRLAKATAGVKEAVMSFKTALPATESLQRITCAALDALRELLKPISFDYAISTKREQFFEGSREWLFAELKAWSEDVASKKKVSYLQYMSQCCSCVHTVYIYILSSFLISIFCLSGVLVPGWSRHGQERVCRRVNGASEEGRTAIGSRVLRLQ